MIPCLFGMLQISPVHIALFLVFLAIALLGAIALAVFLVRSVVKLVRWLHTPRGHTRLDRPFGRGRC